MCIRDRCAAEVQDHKKHIKDLEKDLEAASTRARNLDQELRRQQASMRELDAIKAELDAASELASEWQNKHSCAPERITWGACLKVRPYLGADGC